MMAMLTCGSKCAKYVLFIFNFIFWLTGIALLAVGIWLMVDITVGSHYLGVTDVPVTLMRAAAGTIIGVGVFVFIVGGLGCCSAMRESPACLACYSVVLIFLLVLQVAAIILAGAFYSQITDDLGSALNETIQKNYGVKNNTTYAWNFVQIKFACCGVQGADDWKSSSWRNDKTENVSVPDSCCTLKNNNNINVNNPDVKNRTRCQQMAYGSKSEPSAAEYVNVNGCELKLESLIKTYFIPFICVVVAVILVQLLVVIMTCLLRASIKNAYEFV